MCGIVGFIEKKHDLYAQDFKLFESLLLVDSLRGEDSTGAFSIYAKTGSVVYTKQATNPLNLFKMPEWDKFKERSIKNSGILVGHNRKATVGEIKTENAHPFVEGNTILIHNGGISNWRKFDSSKNVDSHAICSAIDKDGHESVLPELEGAYTLVWYNVKDKMLHFARNNERPLVFMDTEHYQLFGSEKIFLEFACLKNGEKPGKSWELDTHNLASYSLDEKGWYNKKYTPKTKSVTSYGYNYSHYGRSTESSTNTSGLPWVEDVDDVTYPKKTFDPTNPPKVESHVRSPDPTKTEIQRDMVVYFTVDSHRADTTNGRVKVYGKCISPDLEHCDVVHMLSTCDLRVAENEFPIGHIFQGRVLSVASPVCGVTAWLADCKKPECTEDFGGFWWPSNILRYLLLSMKSNCSYCKNDRLEFDDFKFSKVDYEVTNGLNKYVIECPECVYSTLNGEERAKFEKDYPYPLQNSQQILQVAAI